MDADFILIRKMKQGDDKAFDIFVHKYYGDILKYCVYHCSNPEYAEDMTQEAFVHFFETLSAYCYKGKTKNYLYTIAGNLCKNYFKKKKEIFAEDVKIEEKDFATNSYEDSIVERATLEEALNQLPSDLKNVIELYYFRELKLTEVAKAIQIGVPLVKYRLKQAKSRLQKLLEKEEDL